jgi:hypothetical protein
MNAARADDASMTCACIDKDGKKLPESTAVPPECVPNEYLCADLDPDAPRDVEVQYQQCGYTNGRCGLVTKSFTFECTSNSTRTTVECLKREIDDDGPDESNCTEVLVDGEKRCRRISALPRVKSTAVNCKLGALVNKGTPAIQEGESDCAEITPKDPAKQPRCIGRCSQLKISVPHPSLPECMTVVDESCADYHCGYAPP